MKKSSMKATSIRKLLTFLLVLIILGAAAGFYYGLTMVRSFSTEVSHKIADADASGNNIGKLQKLKQALTESESLVSKANKIFATDANYQSQALTDVQKYASNFGLTISSTNFDKTSTAATNTDHTFTVTLQSPTSYQKLLQFLNAVEGNLPKMQVSSISLSRPTTGSATDVTTGDITIVISTR